MISGHVTNAAHRIAIGVISAPSAAVAGANPTPTATSATPVQQLHTMELLGTVLLVAPVLPSKATGNVPTVEVRMAR
jgi:hypothetical protein